MKRLPVFLVLLLLIASAFSLAALLQARGAGWSQRSQSDNVLRLLLGDGRRLFASHFFVKADISFHSGYYPSIFDQAAAPKDSRHMTHSEDEHKVQGHDEAEEEHYRQMAFLGQPRDWIERFGRHFIVTEHKHLEHGQEREILPWLRISAELDPHRVETYTVSAYWLSRLGKVKEAEAFLREGLRNNPKSYELLFELGRIAYENHHDANRARNLWEAAVQRWTEQESSKQQPDLIFFAQVAVRLSRLEEAEGNYSRAVFWLEATLARKASPNPEALQEQVQRLRGKLTGKP